jgi:hypothetical protein
VEKYKFYTNNTPPSHPLTPRSPLGGFLGRPRRSEDTAYPYRTSNVGISINGSPLFQSYDVVRNGTRRAQWGPEPFYGLWRGAGPNPSWRLWAQAQWGAEPFPGPLAQGVPSPSEPRLGTPGPRQSGVPSRSLGLWPRVCHTPPRDAGAVECRAVLRASGPGNAARE